MSAVTPLNDNLGCPHTHHAYLGMGSSLGDRLAHLQNALRLLHTGEAATKVVAISPLYESPHLGLEPGDEQHYPPHLNCAACVETARTPQELLELIQHIEEQGWRQRTQRWGPRTIDIDLLLYDDLTLQSENLTIPHPGLKTRAFVLKPLQDLMPDLVLPDGQPIRELLASELIRAQQIERVTNHELLI